MQKRATFDAILSVRFPRILVIESSRDSFRLTFTVCSLSAHRVLRVSSPFTQGTQGRQSGMLSWPALFFIVIHV